MTRGRDGREMHRQVEKQLTRILEDHSQRYPRLQVVDLYKLLHQASMGSEHAASNEEDVRAWLEKELDTMGAGRQEPLIDPISPEGEIVRVHLGPYVEAGHDPEKLLEAFLRTAREYRGSVQRLRRYWGVAEQMAFAGRLSLLPDQIDELMQRMEGQGFPAMHHSQIYRILYRPAYRVVARTFLKPVPLTW
jgi:hypothetical protein